MIVARNVSDKLERASWIRKMFEEGARLRAERGADRVFDFSLGNPEIEPPEALLATVRRLLDEAEPRRHAYMPNAGFPDVRERIAARLAAESGLPFDAGHVIMTVGAGGALNTLFKAILDPGDEVIVLAPYFVEYGFYIENHGGRMVLVDTDDAFRPDIERIEAAITERTRAIVVNSPNNPTGVLYDERDYARLDELAARDGREILVVSDEPYRALVFDGVVAPVVPRHVRHAVVCTSWSKSLAIPGERIGYIAISPRVPDAAALAGACTFTHRILGFVNAPALWQRVVAEVGELTIDIGPYQDKRDLLCDELEAIGYELVRPRGAFYVFPRTPIDDLEFIGLLQQEGILAVPGRGFGRANHMRLSLTVPRETIERAIPGFEAAFRKASRAGA
ncbi:MAG: pyridoxal phosphate-dependent aminotransferase [Acidobacteriota bacterium]